MKFFFLSFVSAVLSAQVATLEPSRISSQTNIEAAIASAKSHARTEIVGRGEALKLHYSTNAPMKLFIIPLYSGGRFNPASALSVNLPPGENAVQIHITRSPDWRPTIMNYALHFLGQDPLGADIEQLIIVESTIVGTMFAAVFQYMQQELFTPSSYHRLRGQTVFGLSMHAIVGIMLSIATVVLVVGRKKQAALILILLVVLIGHLRFSVDTGTYAYTHVQTWLSNKTYGAAGSLYDIAETLKHLDAEHILLCSDGTSYKPTILKYALSHKQLHANDASHIIVSGAADWSFNEPVLRCNKESWNAEKVQQFPDGSVLFKLT